MGFIFNKNVCEELPLRAAALDSLSFLALCFNGGTDAAHPVKDSPCTYGPLKPFKSF